MKIWYANYAVVLMLCCMQSQAQTVASAREIKHHSLFSKKEHQPQKVPLKDFLKGIEKKHNVSIAYQNSLVNNIMVDPKTAEITTEKSSVEKGLTTILKVHNLKFKKPREGYYVLYKDGATEPKQLNSVFPNSEETPERIDSIVSELTIAGKVTDKKTDSGIPGVSILLKGTNIGTVTDAEGKYKVNLPDGGGKLVFSFVGFETQEVETGNVSTLDIVLVESAQHLAEVVVTALGFQEVADRVASTSSKINAADIVRSGETGVINGLSGKASGVQITRSAGDPGAGSYIQIRGQNTITGSTQPLVIVDGIPISNSTVGEGTAGVTQQSRLNDINPDDIASLQVLKGASAAALWGSRAANGVIIITTKKGTNNNKVNISLSSTVSFDTPNRLHPLQSSYGQGSNGVYNPQDSFSWGDKISSRSGAADELNMNGQRFEAYNGQIFYPIIKKNSQETFQEARKDEVFRTGTYLDNNLAISGGNDKGNFYLSFGDLRQKGILNGQSDYNRTSMRFNSERKFNDIIKTSTKATYARTTSNRVQRSNSVNGLYIGMLRTPPDFDSRGYKGNYYASPTASPIPNREVV